jgi:hypothetical protein
MVFEQERRSQKRNAPPPSPSPSRSNMADHELLVVLSTLERTIARFVFAYSSFLASLLGLVQTTTNATINDDGSSMSSK